MQQAPMQKIGPYRIDSALGQGGMGQVYRAWDERLQRRVALKFLQATQQEDKLLHEARMIATLNHPHIMQIYDILVEGGYQVLVLEWVDGINLRQLQGQQPLTPLQVYHYARQILNALASAQRLNLVHGDLKAENIMVNQEGQIKILDFGLARLPHQSNVAKTAGTGRCMSPEQIRGETLDGRSDLFSLGVLLYELCSGQSPFLRTNHKDTLAAVLHDEALPLPQVVAQFPIQLAEFIQHLLSKPIPQRPNNAEVALLELESVRPSLTAHAHQNDTIEQTLIDVQANPSTTMPGISVQPTQASSNNTMAATDSYQGDASGSGNTKRRFWPVALLSGLLLLILGLGYWHTNRPQMSLRYIAITAPDITGIHSSEQEATLAASIKLAARQELENHQGLIVLPDDVLQIPAQDQDGLGRATGADELIQTSLVCAGNECNIQLQRLDKDQQEIWRRSFSSPPEAQLLYRALRIYLQEAYAELPRLRQQANSINPADLDRLLWLQGEFERNEMQHLDSAEMLRQIDELLDHAPNFEEAHLLRSRVLLYRYHQHADNADLEQARRALDMVGVTPGSRIVLFQIALVQNDLLAAEQALESYARLQPGSAGILAMRSRLAERKGESQRALILMHEAAQRQPSWRHWFWAAEMAYRQGNVVLAKSDLEALLQLVPEHYGGLSLLAEIEMQSGHLSTAESIYKRLVVRSPQLTELSNLGTAYLFLGQFDAATQSFRQALELAPENPYVRLNLADSLKLNGDFNEATEAYHLLVNTLQKETLNNNLLGVLSQAEAHINMEQAARHHIEQLLEDAEHQAQALYTAAVVYAVLEDQKLATHYRQQAEAAGIDTLWFSLPWFSITEQ